MEGAEPNTELLGEATDGEVTLELALELSPDVILTDLDMPKLSGIEATRCILEASPDSAILMLTMFEDEKSIFAVMRAGAHGYVFKGADGAETLRAIQVVANGEAIFSPGITRRLMGYFAVPGTDSKTSSMHPFPNLTERKYEIFFLMAEAYTNTASASRIYLSPRTVRNYASTIFTKLQVADHSQAIVRACEAGLGTKRGST